MDMYPKRNLYNDYLREHIDAGFSSALPDRTKRITLEHIENAIRYCDAWDSFLDVGGGGGHYSMALATLFKKGTIIELVEHREHALLPENFPTLTLFRGPAEKYPGESPFDFILLSDIFEHIPNIRAFSEKMAGLQKAGGVIYLMTPNPVVCGPAPESGIHHTRHPFGHIKHYAKQELIDSFKPYGYEPMLELYEEGSFRQEAKRIIRGLSRRDYEWSRSAFYRAARFLFLGVAIPVSEALGRYTYGIEKRNERDDLFGMTQCLVLKKIRQNQ